MSEERCEECSYEVARRPPAHSMFAVDRYDFAQTVTHFFGRVLVAWEQVKRRLIENWRNLANWKLGKLTQSRGSNQDNSSYTWLVDHNKLLLNTYTNNSSSETIIFMFLGVATIHDDHEWNWAFVILTITFCTVFR